MLNHRIPASVYRLQLSPGFGFAEAADLATYLANLGVTHAYLSPILQAVPGSSHGYDVIDHSRISAELGGEDGFRSLAGRLARHGIGLVVDVVPNHMAVPAPEYLNRALWSVLAEGDRSAYAHWFDIDWSASGRVLLPIFAEPVQSCLGELEVTRLGQLRAAMAELDGDDAPVLRYQDHVLPLRPGTERLPIRALLAAQHYELAYWRTAATRLNWRRFFDITSLIAIRVEEPDVFAATHGLLLELVAEGLIDGLRIDHPDGLADPRGYLDQLTTATGGRWIVAEKILAVGEELPSDWQCAGTTGYDSLAAVGAVLTDAVGASRLRAQYAEFARDPEDFAATAWTAKREIANLVLGAEVDRLGRLLERIDEPAVRAVAPADVRLILTELLAAFPVYRAYVVPGEPPPDHSVGDVDLAAAAARHRLPRRLHEASDAVAAMLLGRGVGTAQPGARNELAVRFQQTCAAVQAKGVEDTAAYRWTPLLSANEVGSDPDRPSASAAEFHAFAKRLSENWPATMTALSTHDAKRQEDVRARIAALAEFPVDFAREVSAWRDRAVAVAAGPSSREVTPPDPPTEYLLWQTLVGAWPLDVVRLGSYLRKAMREAKLATSWIEPDLRYEAAAISFAEAALTDVEISGRIAAFAASLDADAGANALSAKLIQLTMPGVPDVYQGCELAGLALVDPDNRRPVDFDRRRSMLTALDSDEEPAPAAGATDAQFAGGLDAAKLLVTCRALRLRRDHPSWFVGDYEPVTASGEAAAHVLAFCRAGTAITVATRLPAGLRQAGGWRDTALAVAPGRWRDVLTGREHPTARPREGSGWLPLADVLARLPVALLVAAADRERPSGP